MNLGDAEECGMRIGELSRRSGFSIDTLRYYDRIGLLRPLRRSPTSRFREYGSEALDLLALVRAAKLARLKLPEIRKILSAAEDGAACKEVILLLDAKVKEIDGAIRSLSELRRRLAEAVAKGLLSQPSGRVCPILLGLEDAGPSSDRWKNSTS